MKIYERALELYYWAAVWLMQAITFLRKMKDYAACLWEDRDYDEASLLRLMSFKLSRMEKELSVSELERSDEINCIRMAANALDRLADADYENATSTAALPVKAIGGEGLRETQDLFLDSYKATQMQKQLDRDEAFDTIKDNYMRWWG